MTQTFTFSNVARAISQGHLMSDRPMPHMSPWPRKFPILMERRGSQNGLRNRYSSRSKGTIRTDLETRTHGRTNNTSTSTTFPTSLWVVLRAKWDSSANQVAVNQRRTKVQYAESDVDTQRARWTQQHVTVA